MHKKLLGVAALLVFLSVSATAMIPIKASDLAARRDRVFQKLSPRSALLLMSGDIFKDGDMDYFAGTSIKGSVYFGLKEGRVDHLFLPPASPDYGVGGDVKLSPGKAAQDATGIMNTVSSAELEKTLIGLLKDVDKIYVNMQMDRKDPWGLAKTPQAVLLDKLKAAKPGLIVEEVFLTILESQETKSPAEIERMRRAVAITGQGVIEAMRLAAPGLYEYNLEAAVNYVHRANGAKATFNIIGAGPNSVILHHRSNDRRLEAGDLAVIDVGCAYDGFDSDITRTIPVSGKFTPEQKKIYEIVLDVNKKMIAMAKPGVDSQALDKIAHEMIEKAGYGKYFNHGLGHPLSGGTGMVLTPGSIITIEPGIYIPEKGFGIRIEDDILITANGCEVLSAMVPKEVADVEKLMAQESALGKIPAVK